MYLGKIYHTSHGMKKKEQSNKSKVNNFQTSSRGKHTGANIRCYTRFKPAEILALVNDTSTHPVSYNNNRGQTYVNAVCVIAGNTCYSLCYIK